MTSDRKVITHVFVLRPDPGHPEPGTVHFARLPFGDPFRIPNISNTIKRKVWCDLCGHKKAFRHFRPHKREAAWRDLRVHKKEYPQISQPIKRGFRNWQAGQTWLFANRRAMFAWTVPCKLLVGGIPPNPRSRRWRGCVRCEIATAWNPAHSVFPKQAQMGRSENPGSGFSGSSGICHQGGCAGSVLLQNKSITSARNLRRTAAELRKNSETNKERTMRNSS